MSKEKLNQIDELVDCLYTDRIELRNFVAEGLEQEDEVENLRKIVNAKIALVNRGDEEVRYAQQERAVLIEQQKKRYREALEKAKDELDDFERYGNKCATNAYIIICEVLEESE